MANIGQLLIKLGKFPRVDGWMFDGENVPIKREEFEEIMRAPGTPCYAASKTILDKWRALRYSPGLVVSTAYPLIKGEDGELTPDESKPANLYVLNKDAARRIIEDTIPKRIRNNYAAKNYYLKTGEVR